MTPVFVALTAEGAATARRAAATVGGELHAPPPIPADEPIDRTASHLRRLFDDGTPIVGVCAVGILIRILAPLLSGKRLDPPVLAMSEAGDYVVPLLGGHSGANELARRIADALGTHAAVTTTGDNRFGVTLDVPPAGWTLANPESAKSVMAALLGGASARLEGHAPWLQESRIDFAADGPVRLIATTQAISMRDATGTATSPLRGGRSLRGAAEANFGRGAGPLETAPPSRNSHASSLRSDAANLDPGSSPGQALPARGRSGSEPAERSGAFGSAGELALIYHPRRLAVGLGCERGADPEEAVAVVRETLEDAGLAPAAVALVASLDLKADEPAVLTVAERLGVPARFFAADALEAETPRLRNPSDAVFREVGCHGVAEGAALAAASSAGALVVPKRKGARITCAVAEAPDIIDAENVGRARGRLAIVGIGPGRADWLTPEARRLLQTSDAVVGYTLYLDLVAPLVAGAERFDSPLGAEGARVRQALALAAEGRSVALVSSGDAGIYAMASLAFECLDQDQRGPPWDGREPSGTPTSPLRGGRDLQAAGAANLERGFSVAAPSPPPEIRAHRASRDASNFDLPARGRLLGPARGHAFAESTALPDAARRVEIVVAPGISAMQAAAARAGAPLGHDFCAISLSDLLTPWATIEARIRAAAEGDFVVAFYNPVSQRRRTQLAAAKEILLRHRPPDTPVVLARNLGRANETVATLPLSDLSVDAVDMLTLVIVGASTTRQVEAAGRCWTYTPRGYEAKRNADAAE